MAHHHSAVDMHPSKPLPATPPRRRRSTSAKTLPATRTSQSMAAGARPGAPSCRKTRRRKSRLAGGPATPLAGEEADRQPTSCSQDRRQAAGTMMPPLCRGASAATKSPLTMKKPSPGILEEHRSDRYPSGSSQLRRGSGRRPCPRCIHVLMLGVLIIHLI